MNRRQLVIACIVMLLSLSGCVTARNKFPPAPYFFSSDKANKPINDGFKITYKDFKNFNVDWDKFIIVDEYARLRGVNIDNQPIREAEDYFATIAEDDKDMLMTEVMDGYFKYAGLIPPKNNKGIIYQKRFNLMYIDSRLFETIRKEYNKSEAETLQVIALTHLELKRWNRADYYFRKALQLNPKLYMSWYNLGFLYIDTEKGYNYFKKATIVKPDFSTPYYWMAYYRCRNREDKKAIPLFEKYIELAIGDKEEAGRVKVAKEVLADLKAGREGQSLSMMRRLTEEEEQ